MRPIEDKTQSTIFKDFSMLMVLSFIVIVFILMPYIHEPTKDTKTDEAPAGDLSVYVTWPNSNNDVDVWTLAPGEPNPVGYSAMKGVHLNLLRDDLGNTYDPSPANFENLYSRGFAEGEYIINVHCWRCEELPVPVQIEVRVSGLAGQTGSKVIARASVMLTSNREERTAIRFRVGRDGKVDSRSINHIYYPIKNAPEESAP